MTTRIASTQTKYCESNRVTRRYRVKSESGNTYTVVAIENLELPFGAPLSTPISVEWRCSCRGWTMHTPRRDCKHITHVKENCR